MVTRARPWSDDAWCTFSSAVAGPLTRNACGREAGDAPLASSGATFLGPRAGRIGLRFLSLWAARRSDGTTTMEHGGSPQSGLRGGRKRASARCVAHHEEDLLLAPKKRSGPARRCPFSSRGKAHPEGSPRLLLLEDEIGQEGDQFRKQCDQQEYNAQRNEKGHGGTDNPL